MRLSATAVMTLITMTGVVVVPSSSFSPSFVVPTQRANFSSRKAANLKNEVLDGTETPRFGSKNLLLRMSSASSIEASFGKPTELPDSLDDAAEIAAQATYEFAQASGPMTRCRVDFDTTVGDETYTKLKSSTEFMQKFTTALCYATVPGLLERRQQEMMKVSQARAELKSLMQDDDEAFGFEEDEEEDAEGKESTPEQAHKKELLKIISEGGRDPENSKWDGPKVRIYFPDEGSAALARRDWKVNESPEVALVPPCVEFSSCGGVQIHDITNDIVVLFFCPRASESEYVEEILQKTEETNGDKLVVTVFVNPLLVDMGVTGYGLAGRRLRERLIDNLTYTYYLRTLQWGALTRIWPRAFTVWQEDENEADGYRMIKSLDRLPSNPEVKDIYDIENGLQEARDENGGFGVLNALGDFMNGMMKL